MCVNIIVIFPTIETFLLLYSLHCGSLLIFFWTLLRSLFCVLFFSTAILEVLVGQKFPLFVWFVQKAKPVTNNAVVLYYILLVFLICESILFLHMLHFGYGVCRGDTNMLAAYLVCRLITWIIEVTLLSVLCLIHEYLIGWYLGILFFVELYSLVVVYSFYASLQEEEKNMY